MREGKLQRGIRRYFIPLFPIGLFLLVGHVPASALTAGELLAQCEQLERSWVIRGTSDVEITRPDFFDAGRCWGYLAAFFEIGSFRVFNPENPTAPLTNPLHMCLPKGMNSTQVIRMFLQQARNNPGSLHQNAYVVVLNMLTKQFPCSD
jgi:hypothetical protein